MCITSCNKNIYITAITHEHCSLNIYYKTTLLNNYFSKPLTVQGYIMCCPMKASAAVYTQSTKVW